ncbi:MAG TPA: hypothetical protein VHM26_04000 [Chitinophagaceae bacterium]|jgi:hypothetical protein|nr:hypothetical protein [Chitinophagaceae bacterium]
MSQHNNHPSKTNDKVVIVIDLEDLFHGRGKHPENDPGVEIRYNFKIDGDPFQTEDRRPEGNKLMGIVGKSYEDFELFQRKKHGNDVILAQIDPHEKVDLGDYGIEYFVTKPRVYHFYIGQKRYETKHKSLTVRQILVDFAKVDPKEKTLARKEGGGYHEYHNLDEVIPLKDCPHFTIFDNEPCIVS